VSEPRTFTTNSPTFRSLDGLVRMGEVDVKVASPAACVEIREFSFPANGGALELLTASRLPEISEDDHRGLLGRGLEQNRSLWASLATK
jgi:hypothetical protein